jgi:hypothetical protein
MRGASPADGRRRQPMEQRFSTTLNDPSHAPGYKSTVPVNRAALSLAALSAVCFGTALVVAGGGPHAPVVPSANPVFARVIQDPPATSRSRRLARAASGWSGGPITTSTGETVTVYVSDTYAPGQVSAQTWAEFIAHLDHGPELSLLTTYIAPLAEIQQICGADALGCYGSNELYTIGEPAPDGTTPEDVVRHEYGHHIAFNRENAPWQAVDWGPKQWATTEGVCSRVSQGAAYPGNEKEHYNQNPGEAWAETYRILEERKAGVTTGSWPIIAPDWYPSDAALAAAERDVVQPWTAGTTSTSTMSFSKKSKGRVRWISLKTPLDGTVQVTARLPKGGLENVALVGSDKKSVLQKARWAGTRVKKISTTICGQRSLFVRVTQKGSFGDVSVTASTP